MKQRRTINFIEKLNENEMSNLKGGRFFHSDEEVTIVVIDGKYLLLLMAN